MLELKFAIYHRAASLSSQASSVDAVLPEESLTRHLFKLSQKLSLSLPPCTPTIFLTQWSWVISMFHWVIITLHYISLLSALCTCIQV